MIPIFLEGLSHKHKLWLSSLQAISVHSDPGERLECPLSLPSLFGAGFQSTSLFSPAADGGLGNLQKNQSKMHLVVITY